MRHHQGTNSSNLGMQQRAQVTSSDYSTSISCCRLEPAMDDGWSYLVDLDDDHDLMRLIALLPPPPEPHHGSAFAPYQRPSSSLVSPGRRRANVHRSMHEHLLRRMRGVGSSSQQGTSAAGARADERVEPQVPRSSAFRHITRERLRRESLSQGYADIRALLPPGRASNGAKNFVLAAAVDYIRELEGRKGGLTARNEELDRAAAQVRSSESDGAAAAGGGTGMVVQVRGEGGCSSMGDVLQVVLRRLKAMDELRVTAVQSCCLDGVMRMDVGVESTISWREVDRGVTNALMELEEIKSGCLQQGPTKRMCNFTTKL